jgi:hypothetical protein
MVFYVPIYFLLDAVERVVNDSVVLSVLFEKFVNECNNNSEPASNESNDHAFSHVITVPGGTGFRPLLWRLLHATRLQLHRRAAI